MLLCNGLRICPTCGGSHKRSHQYCLTCHNAYMRKWRNNHVLTKIERFKMNARSYAHVYLKRGKIKKKPCESCGRDNSQMHHDDYAKPTDVRWFCRPCHLAHHKKC